LFFFSFIHVLFFFKKKGLTEDQIAYISANALKGLAYLHTQKIVCLFSKQEEKKRNINELIYFLFLSFFFI